MPTCVCPHGCSSCPCVHTQPWKPGLVAGAEVGCGCTPQGHTVSQSQDTHSGTSWTRSKGVAAQAARVSKGKNCGTLTGEATGGPGICNGPVSHWQKLTGFFTEPAAAIHHTERYRILCSQSCVSMAAVRAAESLSGQGCRGSSAQ